MKILVQTSILRTFRRRLTNLSSRNRSLVLTSLPASQFLDVHETDFLLNKPSFSIIADLIGRKNGVSVCEVLDARQERSNEVSRKLRRIDRTARFIEEERGTEDLYVGWPFVKGKLLDDTVIHGPLLFFPVQLSQQGKFWKITRRGDELAFLNPTLALAYGQFNQIKLPDEVVEKTMDDFDRDPLSRSARSSTNGSKPRPSKLISTGSYLSMPSSFLINKPPKTSPNSNVLAS